tara:strand:- start:256 stop:528 length:273 start_codon:yes stop_codon:yes gene_type:complete
MSEKEDWAKRRAESVSHEEAQELNSYLLKFHHPCDVSAPAKWPPAEETLEEDITYIRQALVRLEDSLERIEANVQCKKNSSKGCSCGERL